jgi:DNA-binding transcriptional LysR family regulator
MLSDYDIYVKVVSTGSLSAAARDFGLSPAMVSKRLTRLEERLGVRLLQRTTRKAAMTDVGQAFYDRAVQILQQIEETERLVSGTARATGGMLKVTAPTSFGRLHVAPHLGPFLSAHPDVRMQLDLTDDFVDLIADGVDLAVRITPPVEGPLSAHQLCANHRVLCASPAYLEAHGEPAAVADLEGHRLLAASNQSPWRLQTRGRKLSVPVESYLRTNSSEVVREAVLAGLGIGLRSTWDVSDALARGDLRIVLPEVRGAADVGIYAVHPSSRLVSPNVKAFVAYLSDLYGGTPYWDRQLEAKAA